jgi:hypothetical protein
VFHFAAKKFDPYKLAIQTARKNRDFIDVLGDSGRDSRSRPERGERYHDGCAVMVRAVRQAAKRGVAVAEVAPNSNSDLLRRYHVLSVPTALLLDKTSKEITRFEGEDVATVKAVQNRVAALSEVSQ